MRGAVEVESVVIDLKAGKSFCETITRTLTNFPLLVGSGLQIELSYQLGFR
jgi:hypothetical protein